MKLLKFFLLIFLPSIALASISEGTIDPNFKYAWGENIGWVNFGCTKCDVKIKDDGLSGYVWSENFGWINLAPTNGGVKNDGEGNLSGFAWGENLGWIDFSNVKINKDGEFTGFASSSIAGRINFDCQNCKVKTDWRPKSQRPTQETPQIQPLLSFSGQRIIEKAKEIPEKIIEEIKKIPEVFKPKEIVKKPTPTPPLEITPFVFQGKWKLLTYTLNNEDFVKFTLSPIPKQLEELAQKFPNLENLFKELKIEKLPDIAKLQKIEFKLPGLTERVGLPGFEIVPGKFALPKGTPLSNLSLVEKEKIPSEVLFVRSKGEVIDFNINLSLNEKGEVEQKIKTVSGQTLYLIFKPQSQAKSVKGYLVFKSKKVASSFPGFSLENLTASLFFTRPVFAKMQTEEIKAEEKLVLKEFDFQDPDQDGIWTAEISAPAVDGEYEIITLVEYEDPGLGKRAIRLIAVVDPEGYVFEKVGNQELRISGAIVTLYWLNPETKKYEIWPAREYYQENPQITDQRGAFAFLVPPGVYYLKVEAPGYLTYEGKPFEVREGEGIHPKIELKNKLWFLKILDWKTILLILLFVLLLYNFYRDKMRERREREFKELLRIKL